MGLEVPVNGAWTERPVPQEAAASAAAAPAGDGEWPVARLRQRAFMAQPGLPHSLFSANPRVGPRAAPEQPPHLGESLAPAPLAPAKPAPGSWPLWREEQTSSGPESNPAGAAGEAAHRDPHGRARGAAAETRWDRSGAVAVPGLGGTLRMVPPG